MSIETRRLNSEALLSALLLLLAVFTPARALEFHVGEAGADSFRAVTEAQVSLWRDEHEGEVALVARGRVDDTGSVHLEAPRGGPLIAVVTAPGFARFEQELSRGDFLDVRLHRGRSLRFSVQDADGRQVVRFRWSIVPSSVLSPPVLASVLAGKEVGGLPRGESEDRGGSLAYGLEGCRIQEYQGEAPVLVKGLGPEDYDLWVAAPGSGFTVRNLPADRTGPVVVRLDSEGCRQARVVDKETHQPLEGGIGAPSPDFLREPLRRVWPSWPTGADGMLTIGCSRTFFGRQGVGIVTAPGHAPIILGTDQRRALATESEPRIEMGKGAVLEGRAIDEEGQPVSLGRVDVTVSGLTYTRPLAADGSFRFEGLPAGAAFVQLFDEAAGAVTGSRRLVIEADSHSMIHLGPGRELSLHLLDGTQPLSGWMVLLGVGSRGEVAVLAANRSDEQGIARLLPPEWSKEESPSLLLIHENTLITAPLPARGLLGQILDRLRGASGDESLELSLDGQWIEGRVVDDQSDEAVEGMLVRSAGRGICRDIPVPEGSLPEIEVPGGVLTFCDGWLGETLTDVRGRFRVFVPSDARSVSAREPYLAGNKSYSEESVAVATSHRDRPLVIRVRSRASLMISALGEGGRTPAGCFVGWKRTEPGPYSTGSQGECSSSGSTEFGAPVGEPLLVVASAPGYASAMDGPFILKAGEQRRIQLSFSRPGSIVVHGVSLPVHNGRPYLLPGTLLDAAGRDWTYLSRPELSPSGTKIVFRGLPSGQWTVSISNRRERVRVHPQQESEVDFSR